MAYAGRDWDNTGTKVTKEDFKRIEEGIKNNDNQINDCLKFKGTATDLNALVDEGIYNITPSTLNSPLSGAYGKCLVFKNPDNNATNQAVFKTSGGGYDCLAVRNSYYSGTKLWTPWLKMAPTEVATPTPVNGWTQYAGHQQIKLIKTGNIVNLFGFVNVGVTTANTIMLTGIPVGFRPSSVQAIRVADLDVRIPTDGTMVLMSSETPSYNCYNGICWEV